MLPHRPGRLRLLRGPWRWLESRPALIIGPALEVPNSVESDAPNGEESDSARPTRGADSTIVKSGSAVCLGFPRQHVASPVWSLLAQRIIAGSALGTISEQYGYRTILVQYRAAVRRITSVGRALAGGIPSQGTGCACKASG